MQGAVKVVVGVTTIAGLISGTAATGGLAGAVAAVGLVGALGLTASGVMQIACGLENNQNLCDGGTAVGNATSPGAIILLIGSGGNQTASTLGTLVTDAITYLGEASPLNGLTLVNSVIDSAQGIQESTPGAMAPPTYINVDGGQAPALDYVTSDLSSSEPLVYSGYLGFGPNCLVKNGRIPATQ